MIIRVLAIGVVVRLVIRVVWGSRLEISGVRIIIRIILINRLEIFKGVIISGEILSFLS